MSNVQSQAHPNLTSEVEIGTDPEAVKRKIEMKLLNLSFSSKKSFVSEIILTKISTFFRDMSHSLLQCI